MNSVSFYPSLNAQKLESSEGAISHYSFELIYNIFFWIKEGYWNGKRLRFQDTQ